MAPAQGGAGQVWAGQVVLGRPGEHGAGAEAELGAEAGLVAEAERSGSLTREARRVFGGLLSLVDDPRVRDILLQVQRDGAGSSAALPGGSSAREATDADRGMGRLWVDRGHGTELVEGWSVTPEQVRRFAVDLIAAGGRHLDESNPSADVRLGDGIRVHAVLPPVAVAGAAVSIRLPNAVSPSLAELAMGGLCPMPVAAMLERAVLAKQNILITGGTASGKTTLLTALLSLVPPRERIITIEDVAELRPTNGHHLALETRQANIERVGEVSLEHLLREALRMRPDRIVLGECRGAELVTLLSALNTGHEGGAGTLHANSIEDVPARLEALGMLAGLNPSSLARQAVSALHLIVHVGRREGRHSIEQIGRLRLAPGGELEVEQYGGREGESSESAAAAVAAHPLSGEGSAVEGSVCENPGHAGEDPVCEDPVGEETIRWS